MKYLFSFILVSSIMYAGLFDKNFEFQKSQNELKREFPTQEKYLLSYNNILEEVRTSVVNISTKKNVKVRNGYANPFFNDPFFRDFFRGFGNPNFNVPQKRVQQSLGSGVIISEDGYIVTNNHVIEGADEITVTIPNLKKDFDAKIIGTDEKSDLAVIKIDSKDLNAIKLYDSNKVKLGDVVFALGNPFGIGQTITQGMVSATGRSSVGIVEYENFIQTDAPINPGNSGGALINSAGYLIGINSAIISKSGGNVGIGFAIPSNMVEKIVKILINDGEFIRAYLGVSIADVQDNLSKFYGKNAGAVVTSVQKDTPAEKIGLKRGDLIISVNNTKIDSAASLKNIIGTFKANEKVKIEYLRNKNLISQEVKLGSSDDATYESGFGMDYKGMQVEPLSENIKKELGIPKYISGVYISEIKENSIASKKGIEKGDIIIQIENNEISNLKDFKEAIKNNSEKRFYINRRGNIYILVM